jgi:protein-L-isoaspartate(D-aspartate) O-methyltransferase
MVERTVRARGIHDARVLSAMMAVPRHEFVPSHLRPLAYADQPLPIGEAQTISQPYIVALMTALAEVHVGDRCLEIGTGSGYQTAILAEMGASIVTVEIRNNLAQEAKSRLEALGYSPAQIQCHTADGQWGWPNTSPYDAILVTAAPDQVPQQLLSQLAPHGRLVVPIGPRNSVQRLEKWVRHGQDEDVASYESEFVLNVQFVPMQ